MFGTTTSARSNRDWRRLVKSSSLSFPVLAILFALSQVQLLAEETSPPPLSLDAALNSGSRQPARFVLIDGRTVLGRVVKMGDGALTIRRPSLGLQRLLLETIVSVNIKEKDGTLIRGRIVRMADGAIGWRADGDSQSHLQLAGSGLNARAKTGGPFIRLETEAEGSASVLAAVEPDVMLPRDANAKPEPVQLKVTADDANESDGVVYFRLTLAEPASRSVLVIYTVINGSAVAPDDIRHRQGTVVFEPGQTFAKVAISIVNDETAEDTESFGFFVTGDPSEVNIDQRKITATITDDDL